MSFKVKDSGRYPLSGFSSCGLPLNLIEDVWNFVWQSVCIKHINKPLFMRYILYIQYITLVCTFQLSHCKIHYIRTSDSSRLALLLPPLTISFCCGSAKLKIAKLRKSAGTWLTHCSLRPPPHLCRYITCYCGYVFMRLSVLQGKQIKFYQITVQPFNLFKSSLFHPFNPKNSSFSFLYSFQHIPVLFDDGYRFN